MTQIDNNQEKILRNQVLSLNEKIHIFNDVNKSSQIYGANYFRFIKFINKFSNDKGNISDGERKQAYELGKKLLEFSSFIGQDIVYSGIDKVKVGIYGLVIYYLLGAEQEYMDIIKYIEEEEFEEAIWKQVILILKNKVGDNQELRSIRELIIYNKQERICEIILEKQRNINEGIGIQVSNIEAYEIIVALYTKIINVEFYDIVSTNSKLEKAVWQEYLLKEMGEEDLLYILSDKEKCILKGDFLSRKVKSFNYYNKYSRDKILKIIMFEKYYRKEKDVILYIGEVDEREEAIIKNNIKRNQLKLEIEFKQINDVKDIEELKKYDLVIFLNIQLIQSNKAGLLYEIILYKCMRLNLDIVLCCDDKYNLGKLNIVHKDYMNEIKKINNVSLIHQPNLTTLNIYYQNNLILENNFFQKLEINEKKVKGIKRTSARAKSCYALLKLLNYDKKIAVFIPQQKELEKICNRLYDMLKDLESQGIKFEKICIEQSLINEYKSFFAEQKYSELIEYGILIIPFDMPKEIKEFVTILVNEYDIKAILGGAPLVEYELSSIDILIINSIYRRIEKDKRYITLAIEKEQVYNLLRKYLRINKNNVILLSGSTEQKEILRAILNDIKKGIMLTSSIDNAKVKYQDGVLDYEEFKEQIFNDEVDVLLAQLIIDDAEKDVQLYDRFVLTNHICNGRQEYFYNRLKADIDKRKEEISKIERNKLNKIVKLRIPEKLITSIENIDFEYVRNCDDDLERIKYLFNTVIIELWEYKSYIKNILQEEVYITNEIILDVIMYWCLGHTYEEIVHKFGYTIQVIYKVINKIVEQIFLGILKIIIDELNLEDADIIKQLNAVKRILDLGINKIEIIESWEKHIRNRKILSKVSVDDTIKEIYKVYAIEKLRIDTRGDI